MAAWADEWTARALCTDEAAWAAFADAARRCYAYAGLGWHGNVVRVGNPLVLALAAPIAAWLLDGGAVDAAVDGAVGGAVRDAVDGAVDDAVYGAVDAAVHAAPRGTVGDAVRRGWYRYVGGAWWLGWNAYTSFFRDVCALGLPGDLWDRDRAYAEAQTAAGWWWPHRRFVMVCDRPAEVHREQAAPRGWGSHRLHRADGPALRYRDGWALWYWHGTRVPQHVIEQPERITAHQVLAERNAEVRRVMLERMGIGRFVRDADPEVLDTDTDGAGQPRRLLAVDVDWVRGGRMVVCQVRCPSTGHEYLLPVPPETRTCRAAVAWTMGLHASEYAPLVER